MESVESLYFGDVRFKIENAHRLHRDFGAGLGADREIREGLGRLVDLEGALAEAMRSMGMFGLCAECGGRPAGGCCGPSMANETDSLLLLINLLAGFEVGRRREDDRECCFLGPEGCSLGFKPFLCLNYLCRKAHMAGTAEELARLRSATSELLGQLLVVEELVRQRLLAG